jgi:hypothetical protein
MTPSLQEDTEEPLAQRPTAAHQEASVTADRKRRLSPPPPAAVQVQTSSSAFSIQLTRWLSRAQMRGISTQEGGEQKGARYTLLAHHMKGKDTASAYMAAIHADVARQRELYRGQRFVTPGPSTATPSSTMMGV